MKEKLLILSLLILCYSFLFSQVAEKKVLEAARISDRPKIDGLLTDECWRISDTAGDFVQYEPYNGAAPTFQSIFMLVYDDNSIYIGALLYDSEPDKIARELGVRDSDYLNADAVLVSISPYNDGMNSFDFYLYASGVQADIRTFSTGSDISWDAVWKSEVNITEEGWVAEMEIPYSALRFPKVPQQVWGVNFVRENRRLRESSHWNFVDKNVEGILNQAGLLTGISDIRPPLRLSFEPYVSTSVSKEPDNTFWDFKFNGGLDLKYGINESFTLDMTLIPDFSQVPSDELVVNLGPFETYYSEKRQFFTEGVELFSRGNIFYSRRVGSRPMHYEDIENGYPEEDIIENPEQTRLLNATKLSGRNSKGTGLGLFNAFTAPSYATVRDSGEATQEILTQPFTNYNMLVFDQSLPNNSYFSIYNTNVYRGRNEYSANVSGTEMNFKNRKNSFSASGVLNVSQKYDPVNSPEFGFMYQAVLEKIGGNANYGVFQKMESDHYDPNDLGYNESNNEFENGIFFSYEIFDPFWRILNMENEISIEYDQLYAPREFTGLEIDFEQRTLFKNILTVGLEASLSPLESRDYFEPRHEGWFVRYPPLYSIGGFYSPDYNKTFMVDVSPGIAWASEYDQLAYYLMLSPRYRVNEHVFMVLRALYSKNQNDLGYVRDSLENSNLKIIFGERDIENITLTYEITYSINPKLNLSLSLRHYLFKVDYDQYYDLLKDGHLVRTDYSGQDDFIYNSFNIDAYFTWLFAPGSELVLAWKNAIYTREGLPAENYFRELAETLEAPASNLISLKFLYYLDYQYLRKLLIKKNPAS